jgi:hypothetical protein
MGTARSVFNLAALGEKSESYVVRSTNPNHLVSERNVPDECVVPPDRRASVTVGPVERAGVVCAPMSQQRRGQRQHRDPGARAARSLCRHRSRTGAAPWPGCQPAACDRTYDGNGPGSAPVLRQRGFSAEVDKVGEVVLGDEDVRGLDVAVHQSDPVCGVECRGDLRGTGQQPVPIWLTIKVGIGAALLGTALARAMGIPTATSGVDWLELLVQSSTRQLVSLWWPPPSDDGDPECCGVSLRPRQVRTRPTQSAGLARQQRPQRSKTQVEVFWPQAEVLSQLGHRIFQPHQPDAEPLDGFVGKSPTSTRRSA